MQNCYFCQNKNMISMGINERLKALRSEMSKNGIDGYIIPSSDPHQSEYVADHFKEREWISGFTGSAGTVVVLKDHAGLWTDSRYFMQAENELKNSEFVLHKILDRANEGINEFLLENLKAGSKVGCNGKLFSIFQIKEIDKLLSLKSIELITNIDLIVPLWNTRPQVPSNPVIDHLIKYTGKSREMKMQIVRNKMEELHVDEYLIPLLDSVAWITNLRGDDIAFNPVFYSFGVLRKNDFLLFCNKNKFTSKMVKELKSANVVLKDYDEIYTYLSNLEKSKRIYTDTSACNFHLNSMINGEIIEGEDIISKLKTIKNRTEIRNIKTAHINDGVALIKFFIWLEEELDKRQISEYEAGEKIAFFRAKNKEYKSESFEPIVGFKENGAIVHYSATKEKTSMISKDGILLVDSGGQYLDGTTDITRTICLGKPNIIAKRHYTAVLKGHLALKNLIFPEKTNGYQIDTLARQYLWRQGLNFYHGTGHGVGFYLNVHEGPQGITNSLVARAKVPLAEGMITSNEPGYYWEGNYGIRIENLILTKKAFTSEHGLFLTHEDVTLYPYESKLIDKKMLTIEEINQINEYHSMVYTSLERKLKNKEKTWLRSKCKKI